MFFFFLSSIPRDISNHLRAADGGENTKRNNEKIFKKPDELQGVGCKLTPTARSTKKKQNKTVEEKLLEMSSVRTKEIQFATKPE